MIFHIFIYFLNTVKKNLSRLKPSSWSREEIELNLKLSISDISIQTDVSRSSKSQQHTFIYAFRSTFAI